MESKFKPSVSAYLGSWGLELAARQNRIRNLIGDAHWLTDGHHKEAILREFLIRHLPHACECSTGFARRAGTEQGCSPEIDIMLFNRNMHLPYFYEGGVAVIDPASLLATIEVKSSFSADTLRNAIENVKRTRAISIGVTQTSPDLWSGIFFYDIPDSRTLESLVETLGRELKFLISPQDEKYLLPTCVVLGQDCLAFPAVEGDGIRVRAFERSEVAFASAICDLLAFVTPQVGGLTHSGFDEWGTSLPFVTLDKRY